MARKQIGDIVVRENRELGFAPGDQAAHRAAMALADRFDAPTIIALTNALTYTQEMGGQFWAVTLREKVNAAGEIATEDEPGEFQTMMLRFEYESRDVRIVKATTPPSEIEGLPITDFSEAPTQIEVKPEDDDEALAEEAMAAGAEALALEEAAAS